MDTRLLNELYERYSREIYLYLLGLCGNRDDAEELMQEAFLRALLSLNDRHTNVRAWLYTVARNLFYDRARRVKAEHAAVEAIEQYERSKEQPGPEEELLRRLRSRALAAALLKLDPEKREVISLQYLSGLSVRETAAVMGLSQENVRVIAYRAKKILKRLMEENENEIQ